MNWTRALSLLRALGLKGVAFRFFVGFSTVAVGGGDSANFGSTVALVFADAAFALQSLGRPHGETASFGSTLDLLGLHLNFAKSADVSRVVFESDLFADDRDITSADRFACAFTSVDFPIEASSSRQPITRFLANRGERRSGEVEVVSSVHIVVSSCWISRFALEAICLRDGVEDDMAELFFLAQYNNASI